MIQILKSLFKKIFSPVVRREIITYMDLVSRFKKEKGLLKVLLKSKVVPPNISIPHLDDYVRQFDVIYSNYNVDISNYYIYPYNPLVERFQLNLSRCGNIPVDFSCVLNSDLSIIDEQLKKCTDDKFKERELNLSSLVKKLAQKISLQLSHSKSKRIAEILSFFPEMLYRKPMSFDEALQKILFYDAMFWQMGHYHVGLGRLDYILYEYFENDINHNVATEEELYLKIKKFISILGKDTTAKSLVLRGDTGQYILLGGINKEGCAINNRLTELFLDAFTELRIPDPKLILRVNNKTSDFIWQKAIDCIMTGIGSPLIMCETTIMEKMVRFGYDENDVWNVGTSACWEPLIIGKSFDMNNSFRSVVAIKPLNTILQNGVESTSFEDFYSLYKIEYRKEIESVVCDISFDGSPLYSLFSNDCIIKGRDFSDGGAKYAFHGAQVVSFPNTINALLNIQRLVFDENRFSLQDCRDAISSNFNGMEDFRLLLTETGDKFGSTHNRVVSLTNDLIRFTGEVFENLRCNGSPLKVGFSSPNYIEQSKNFEPTMDGRKFGDPFAVHISPISSKIDICEILDFATLLDFRDNCINGNVVDFILPSSYIKQPDKLVSILKDSCSKGVFELQLNVMDKATLIDAKAHPEKYPNLIVRVWGFSAYFNDLPEDFKDNLIRRAEIYETA